MLFFKKRKKINFLVKNFNLNSKASLSLFKKNKIQITFYKIIKVFILIFSFCLLCFLLVGFYYYSNIKNIAINIKSGKNYTEKSFSLIEAYKFEQAEAKARKAGENFETAAKNHSRVISSPLKYLPLVNKYITELQYLINVAQILNKAEINALAIAIEINQLSDGGEIKSFANFNQEQKIKILTKLYQSVPELSGIKANLNLSLVYLDHINSSSIFSVYHVQLKSLREKIFRAVNYLETTIPVIQTLPRLSGYPEPVEILVLLQNSDELRPTGGFIGTYGIVRIGNAEIIDFKTHDIYHLDMPVQELVTTTPPQPFIEYMGLKKWFVRDANWSPDWPTSAKTIDSMYQQEIKLAKNSAEVNNFVAIVGITPNLIIDLLSLIGPINIEGVEYNKDNFVDLLQYRVERGYQELGISKWQRKEIIGEISQEIKNKIFSGSKKQWGGVYDIIAENFLRKNIIIYSSEIELQEIFSKYGISGEIKKNTGDYLMLVDANMASLKTDSVMQRNIQYQVDQNFDGLYAKATINYFHQGNFTWKTGRYRTYSRLYVPAGSQLIKYSGSATGKIEISEELGKTVFATLISIDPGSMGSLYFEYKLPSRLNKIKNYELIIQKQPGNNIGSLIVDLNFINRIKSYSPVGFYAQKINNERIKWTTDLTTDKLFQIEL